MYASKSWIQARSLFVVTSRFVQGDLKDAEAVVAFGQDLDVVAVEIEHVSIDGLQALADAGVEVVRVLLIWA